MKHINGIFAFGIWDEREKSIFLARDPLGVKPLFYSIKNNHLIFGSQIKTLLAHPMVEPVVSEEGVMEIIGLGPARSLGQGVFEEIKEVPPAYCLTFRNGQLNLREYWKLEAKAHEEDFSTTIEHTRSLLVDAVERQLVEALKDAVKRSDLPGMADIDSSLYLFCKEVRKKATVALSGECADEIFGGYPWFTRPEGMNAHTFPWSQSIKERKEIINKDFEKYPIEAYVNEKYLDTIKQVPKLKGESKEEARMRELFYLNMKWFMVTLLNRKDRMSMGSSLEVRVPFKKPWYGQLMTGPQLIAYFIQINTWMEVYGVKIKK